MIGIAAYTALSTVLGVGLSQWVARRGKRETMYHRANARAKEIDRPLVVIGDPDGGVTWGGYGYGDVCFDVTGCPDAPIGKKLTLGIDPIPISDNSAVVFVCYVLELVPNVHDALAEIYRVAGDRENVFILSLQAHEQASALYPGVRWHVDMRGEKIERLSRASTLLSSIIHQTASSMLDTIEYSKVALRSLPQPKPYRRF